MAQSGSRPKDIASLEEAMRCAHFVTRFAPLDELRGGKSRVKRRGVGHYGLNQLPSASKRGQAAIEFLMTYGWVLLVILGMLGALVYFDALNPSLLLPEKCNIGYRLACEDFLVSPTDIKVSVTNSFADDMVLASFNISSPSMTGSCNQSLNNLSLQSGETKSFQMNCAAIGTVNERGKVTFKTLTYFFINASGPAYQFPLYGEIFARVER